MSRLVLAALAPLVCAAITASLAAAIAAPKGSKPAPPSAIVPDAAGPSTSLKQPARIARVRIEVTPGGASIAHDLLFAKDALLVASAGEPTLFVAYTAQARPLAIEATRHALDASGAWVEAGAAKLEVIDVAVKPKTAALLLGPAVQAGHVVRLPRDGAPFGLRLRSAVATEEVGKSVALMARLGVREVAAMPLDAIEVGAALGATLRGARAAFCGKGADPRPLTLSFIGFPSPSGDAGTILPSTAVRTADDDLCVDVLL